MNNSAESESRYSRVAIVLHWAIAALIVANLVIGFLMHQLPASLRGTVVGLHISSGITVLALTAVRVLWRLTHAPPSYPAGMRSWERHAAAIAHFALYATMVLVPLTGWALISANPPIAAAGTATVVSGTTSLDPAAERQRPQRRTPRKVWGLVPLPLFTSLQQIGATPAGVPLQKALHDQLVESHSVGAFLTIALLILHIAGALKHQLIDRRPEMLRMGIRRLHSTRS